jgi:hypothetical protein
VNPPPKIDLNALQQAGQELEFVHAGFECAKEAMQLLVLAADARPILSPLPRDQAIIAAHLVRMMKLLRTLVRQIVDGHGGDQQMALTRQMMDSAGIVTYLLNDSGDSSRTQAYVLDSVVAERAFLQDVRRTIQNRGGDSLPIEDRIRSSIASTLDAAGITEEQIPARRKIGWPTAEERVALLGPTAYTAYRMGSSAIHGSFADIEKRHLTRRGDGFDLNLDSAAFRPQPLLMMGLLATRAVRAYIDAFFPSAHHPVLPRAQQLEALLQQIDLQHEAWLVNHG